MHCEKLIDPKRMKFLYELCLGKNGIADSVNRQKSGLPILRFINTISDSFSINSSILFSVLLLLLTTSVFATTLPNKSITGRVQMSDKTPIAFASVYIGSLNKHVLTDDEGMFEIGGVDFGKYQLQISSMEIKTVETSIDFTASKRHFVFTTNLSSGTSLEEVWIKVQTEEQKIETSGFAVSVIKPGKFASQSIQTNELLDRTAGVKVRQDGGLGSRINYNLNGLSGRSIKIFIDGIPSSSYGSSFSLNSIPPSSIERIEVYKGVVPTYLSDDALGGAINIILKQKRINALNVSGSYGSFNTNQYNVNGSYRHKDGFTLNGTGFLNYSDNNYRVYGPHIRSSTDQGQIVYLKDGAKRFHDMYKSYGGKIDFGFTDVKWADKFLIGGVISGNQKEIQHGMTMENVYGDRYTTQDSYISTLTYAKRDLLLEGLSVNMDATYSDLIRQVVDTVGIMYDWGGKPILGKDGKPLRYSSGAEVAKQKTLELNKDKSLALRTNISYPFLPYQKISVNHFYTNFNRGISDVLVAKQLQMLINTRDLEKNIVAFNYEASWFNNRLTSNMFYKYYTQKATSNEPKEETSTGLNTVKYKINKLTNEISHNGYGMSLSYKAYDRLFLLGSAEKAIRMPSEAELFGSNADNVLSAFDLTPEISNNYNIGFNAGPFNLNKHSFILNATYFIRNTKGMIREAIDQRGRDSKYENLEDVYSKGIDIEFKYSFEERLAFVMSVSKFDVLFNKEFDANGSPYLYYKTQIRNEPSFKLNANLSYTFKDFIEKEASLDVYYNVYYVDKFLRDWSNIGGTNLAEIPAQYPNDVGLTYLFPTKKTTISLDAKNIFNQRIYDNFGLQKPGRAFYIKVTHSFF